MAPSFAGGCHSARGFGDLTALQLGSYDHAGIQAPNRLQAVTTPSFAGKCAIRIEVRPGDLGGSGTDRDEITGTRTLWHNGDNAWYSLAFMLDPNRPKPAPGGWMLIHQFFAQDIRAGISGGSPPFAIEITPAGQIDVDVRGGVKASSDDAAPWEHQTYLARATPGVWHALLIHIRWSSSSDGLVEVWHRRGSDSFPPTPQVSLRGPNVLTVAGHVLPVYAETGIYRSHTTTDQIVYYGGLTAAPTRTGALTAMTAAAGR